MFLVRQYCLLLLTAVIWGSGFIGQKLGMDHVSPFTFTFFRTFLGGLFLLPVIAALKGLRIRRGRTLENRPGRWRDFFLGSLCCGTCLIVAESFQQFGIAGTEVNKASFVTSTYIIFVPLLGVLFGHHAGFKLWSAVTLSVAGLYLMCVHEGLTLEKHDLLVLTGGLCFACHILVIARFVARVDGVILSCGQFFVASVLGFFMMLCTGMPDLQQLRLAAPAFIYCGIMSNGIAYTLQVVGQRGVNPTVATLIMSLESVFGALLGVLYLGEHMGAAEITGALLMCVAVIITQIPSRPAAASAP